MSATCSSSDNRPRATRSLEAIDLSGKVAVVTGAARGIGAAIAAELAAYGASIAVADMDEAGEAFAAELPDGLFQKTDVSSAASCDTLIGRAVDRWGGVDILVNNAGVQHIDPVEGFPPEMWDLMISVMLTGPFLLIRRAIPYMYAKGWGRIISIASASALVAHPFKSAYCSAKHGLLGLTKSIALEAGEKGVTVNAICPAYVSTPFVEQQIADQARTTGLREEEVISTCMLAPAAVKRLIRPEEVAAYAAFLCSDAAGAITGAAQLIDCGWTAH